MHLKTTVDRLAPPPPAVLCLCVPGLQAGKNIERAADDAKGAASDAYESAKEKAR